MLGTRPGGLRTALFALIAILFVLAAGCGQTSTQSTATTLSTTMSSAQPSTTTTTTTQTPVTTAATTTTTIVAPATTTTTRTTTSPPATVPTTTTTTTAPTTTSTSTPAGTPKTIYKPPQAQYIPTGTAATLVQYTLDLINKDRSDNGGLPPVTLDYNAAAQKHAQDMFDNYFLSHWGTDGQKPYMRYTSEGGLQYEGENSAYSGWTDPSQNPASYAAIDPRSEIKNLEYMMVYDDASSNWGHKLNILNKWHKKVSIGVVTDGKRLALVQQFEGDYVQYYNSPPAISGNLLKLSGVFSNATVEIANVSLIYEPVPVAIAPAQIRLAPYNDGYSLGPQGVSDPWAGHVLPPPPPGSFYTGLTSREVVATTWDTSQANQFNIIADIGTIIAQHGNGAYTIIITAKIGGELVNLTNYVVKVGY